MLSGYEKLDDKDVWGSSWREVREECHFAILAEKKAKIAEIKNRIRQQKATAHKVNRLTKELAKARGDLAYYLKHHHSPFY